MGKKQVGHIKTRGGTMKCDCCGRTIDKNYGDAFSYLCADCAGVFMTGNQAKEYIETKGTKNEKQ